MKETARNQDFARENGAVLFEEFSKTERKIAESYLQLVEETGADRFPVSELAKRAGVTRSTFYAHYNNISDVYAAIRDDFVRCARFFLLPKGGEVSLLQMATGWHQFCLDHADVYLALRGLDNRDFAESIKRVWSYHLEVVMMLDNCPEDGFRWLQEAYVPTTNETILHAWLQDPRIRELSPRDLAYVINNQRLHYVTDSLARKDPDQRYYDATEYMSSEVVSIARIQELMQTGRKDYIHNTFTDEEIMQAEDSYIPTYFYAQFYAGKRAVCRSITGLVDSRLYRDISIRMVRTNTPLSTENTNVTLTGRAKELA
ncbi:MAG: TetR family transcriptional regulator, partial [Mogibacterium sp.]|nr:TetR family transcriptional regulator [Mogibacterium sp.]